MSFAVKLDENLGRSHVALLQRAGYKADRVYDEAMSGAEDSVVWERVCAEGRFLITTRPRLLGRAAVPTGQPPGNPADSSEEPQHHGGGESSCTGDRRAALGDTARLPVCCG